MKTNGNAERLARESRRWGGGRGAADAEVERCRREDRGAKGPERGWGVCGGGVPFPTGEGGWEGDLPPPEKKKLILALNMVSFGAFWMVAYFLQFSYLFYTQNQSSTAIGV